MNNKPKRILIAGAATSAWFNMGDEAIFSATITDLRAAIPNLQISVVSANPEGSLAPYQVQEVPAHDIKRIIAAAQESDLLILGGGGLFYDYWGFNVNELLTVNHGGHGVYVDFALLATLLNKPLMLYAVGVGPLFSETGKSFTKMIFEQAQQITVRDAESKGLLISLGIASDKIHVTADPAFGIQEVPLDIGEQRIQEKVPTSLPSPILGVSLRDWVVNDSNKENWEIAISQALDQFVEHYDGSVLFIPLHKKVGQVDDYGKSAAVRQLMKHADRAFLLDDDYVLDEKVSIVRHCDLVLGMRLHSLIFAIRYGIPLVGLAYDPKVSHLLTSLRKLDYLLDMQDLSADHLFATLKKAYEDRLALSAFYRDQAKKQADLARKNAKLAIKLLKEDLPSYSAIPDQVGKTIKSLLIEQSLRVYKRDAQVQALSDQVAERDAQVQALSDQVIERDAQVQALSAQAAERDARVQALSAQVEKEQIIVTELRQALTRITQTLNEIQSSRGWRLVKMLWGIRIVIAPPGSFQSRFLGALIRIPLRWYRNLKPIAAPATPATPAAPAPPEAPIPPAVLALPEAPAAPAPPAALAPPEAPAAPAAPAVPAVMEQSSLPDFIGRYISSPSDTRVFLVTRIFFDPMGNDMQFGGAERYLLELADIIRRLGYEPIIVQCGSECWMRYYGKQPVIGIRVGYDYESFIPEFERLVPRGALAIYSPFELASEKIQMPAIGISHGIYWDDEVYHHSSDEILATINRLKAKIDTVSTLVSVDTNTINWLRTVSLATAKKGVYIPNFVDLEQFSPPPVKKDSQRLTILFPRRLVHQRGFWLVNQILPAILEKYPHVDFHFVGRGGPQEQRDITLMSQKYPGRVNWYFLPPEEMHNAYQKADITLIPTTQSEGTSLSCLEALAVGNAVIATTVGGLPDLILDGYNGLLIEPTAEALQRALERLIEDGLLRQTLGKRGQDVVRSFSIENWQEKWRDALSKHLPPRPAVIAQPTLRFVVFPYAWGVHWHGVKQRPHHLAIEFSRHGFETYWYGPEGRQADPAPGIHLIAQTDELYVNRPVLFIYYPHSCPDIGCYKNPLVIYDVLDDISIYEASGNNDTTAREGREYHQKLLERADIVVASSRMLMEQIRQQRPDAIYLPQGVDIEHFHPQQDGPVPKLKQDDRPIIGYHGAVASWFDGNLVAEMARLRPHYRFVIVGPVFDPRVEAQLRSQPNIELLGVIPYEDLPPYVARFNVGIMPFVLSQLTHAVSPLKILEYLSMRKPVVATPMQEILDWPGVLFAEDAHSFAEKMDTALQTGFRDDGPIEAFVQASTWQQVIQPLLKRLNEKLE